MEGERSPYCNDSHQTVFLDLWFELATLELVALITFIGKYSLQRGKRTLLVTAKLFLHC